jgi:hypothetical protein
MNNCNLKTMNNVPPKNMDQLNIVLSLTSRPYSITNCFRTIHQKYIRHLVGKMIVSQLKIESPKSRIIPRIIHKQQLERKHDKEKNPPKYYDVKKLKLESHKEKFNLKDHKLIEENNNQDIV